LKGEIKVEGAKNAVLKVLSAAVLFKDGFEARRVPQIEDVHRLLELLEYLGIKIQNGVKGIYKLDTTKLNKSDLLPEISNKLRASIVLTGPLLARFGEVTFPHPGGCVIGKRPIDLFLSGFEKMGAKVIEKEKSYVVKAKNGKLKGAEIFFKNQSVTATETFMMAAVLAEGETVLKNCALEPEIVSLGEFLVKCGAKISGLGTPTIKIKGDSLLSGKNKIYETMPDRIEAGSFLILGALAAKDLTIKDCEPEHLDSLISILRDSGVKMEIGKDFIRVKDSGKNKYTATDIKTHEYPGFPTDLQAPMSIFLTQAEGQSFIFETIFEGRLNYLESLGRMGVDAKALDVHRAIINGPTPLKGKEMESPDLRAGLAYVLAAIIAEGSSVVHNVKYIDRGYEQIEERLRKIGVKIERIRE